MFKLKNLNFKILVLSALSLFTVFFICKSIYISYKCKAPKFALEYHLKNNDKVKIQSIENAELIFTSEDLMIYDVNTISKKSFSFEESYIVSLKKTFDTWDLLELNVK